MKYLITLGLIYLAYRFFFARPAITEGFARREPPRQEPPPQKRKREEGEYIDYEEVD
jgi:hypothetical protein